MSEEQVVPTPEAAAKPAAKKEKPPALEDKPFKEFVQTDLLPAVQQALSDRGLADLDLQFVEAPLPVTGDRCWQLQGSWAKGQRRFLLGFSEESLTAPKVFSLADGKATPATLEAFLGDERKITLPLLLNRILSRLNGQKWLEQN
ncbi:DUF2996 domain-containing protein [Synechococcus elongatus]|uniref:DUF2996 domain-containing protein n=2 Tax=Synechococcus elongatus TaxID=32046 RepID=Q31LY1_SYNE7|nr:DUF2996 domain-containing protein [Synechococcus elongatus]ABB57938.1 conserved hypothetical protein [Synechococcus elongatus PCC 7942 = FACHB-805]AJD57582.1 hypothetical protein M744_06895 [Synechococcus elongatus UTEX 2973]MBD2586655.1 DUF2996 domain-containing protein [Synechococcus elongatus FACHB-242]MBD2687729.1 DUF2996 domain-containing protein [Synechococcus elongatus FACHB-1061]MBD2706561.1 DUF2996 domain-containing protein [Synechococcus elongatus PCC 7942 = FACHB-805]